MRPRRVAWLVVKYYLVALGFVLWCGLWFQRSIWLGAAQVLICGLILRHEFRRRSTSGQW